MDPESDEEYTYDQEEQEEYAYSDGEDELSVSDAPMVSNLRTRLLSLLGSLYFVRYILLYLKINFDESHSLRSFS